MYRARTAVIKEIDARDADLGSNHAGSYNTGSINAGAKRVLAEVVHLNTVPGPSNTTFVRGTAVSGRVAIYFDTYALQGGAQGFHLGPMHIQNYNRQPTAKKGRSKGTYLYGRVISTRPGQYQFHSCIVAPELNFFWHTLHKGKKFVHDNRSSYIMPDGRTDLYAAACVLTGNVHTLVHDCMQPSTRPQGHTPHKIGPLSPVHFVLALSLFAKSPEPFTQFCNVLRARKQFVQSEFAEQLTVLTSNGTKALNGGCIVAYIKEMEKQVAERPKHAEIVDDESTGSELSD